jgi:hypothetical protein
VLHITGPGNSWTAASPGNDDAHRERRAHYNRAMSSSRYFSRHLLIAMPALEDPNFARGVTLICQHNEEGAMGLTVNRPSDWRLGEVMRQVGVTRTPPEIADQRVLLGGRCRWSVASSCTNPASLGSRARASATT